MAAPANNTVEKMNWPEIKLQMPVKNNNPIKISLLKVFISKFLKSYKVGAVSKNGGIFADYTGHNILGLILWNNT